MYLQDKHGLSTGVSGNKPRIVVEWDFRSSREKRSTVQVRLRNDPGGGISFVATSNLLMEPVYDTDINSLHRKVSELLNEQDDLASGIKWEDWLEVKITGRNDERDDQRVENMYGLDRTADLELHYASIKRGVTADGTAYHINCNGNVQPFPAPRRLTDGDQKIGSFRTESAAEVAYIQATEANLAALERLRQDMATLRGRIADLVSQDRIQATLELARTAPAQLQYQTPHSEN